MKLKLETYNDKSSDVINKLKDQSSGDAENYAEIVLTFAQASKKIHCWRYIHHHWVIFNTASTYNTSSSWSIHTLALPIQITLIFTNHKQVNVFKTSGNNIIYKVEHLDKR